MSSPTPPPDRWPPSPPTGSPPPGWEPTPQWGPPPPVIPLTGPRPWSGVKVFFVVWGWAILVATAVGLLAGILAAVAVGLVGSEIDPAVGTELPADFTDGLVGAGVAFALLFGVLGGFGFGIGSGLFAAAAAALTHTRLPPAGTGLVAALVGTGMTFLGTVAPVAAGGQGAEGFVVVAAIPLAVMFVGLFLVTWLTARRSARAARGA